MKKAILAVSFGTTYAEAEQTCIRPVEAALAAAYPDWEVRRDRWRKWWKNRECFRSRSSSRRWSRCKSTETPRN